jgi:CRISPR/Cas system-associated protein Cas10 (large subunit of type III CRISPR-Cas system)
LNACPARKEANEELRGKASKKMKDQTIYHLQIEGLYLPMYWLNIEIPSKAKLKDLDRFLRDIWLECCGHLSSFEISGQSFLSERFEPGDRSMMIALEKVMAPGMKFEHVYDFGTSTELQIKVVSARTGLFIDKDPIRIMARNEPPDIRCDVCGKPATGICCVCSDEGSGNLCDECGKKHECGEDMLLPVVNSPRAGMCGYTGDAYD